MLFILKKWFTKERNIIIASLSIGIIAALILGATKGYSEAIQSGIASSVIRFHVIANSNDDKDQALKLLVRDAVLADLNSELSKCNDINETRSLLTNSLDNIKDVARKTIVENGYNYAVDAFLSENTYFPTKEYGDIIFPAGNYESLKIIIGNGKGNNWWCVMFPPLCFVDITHKVTSDETKNNLKNVLTDEEYNLVVRSKSEDSLPFKIKFKIVEWWQEKDNKNEYYVER